MQSKIHWTWKRITGTVLGVLGIGTLTSCYGVIEDEFDVYGTVTGSVDGTVQPIEGISVELQNLTYNTKETKTTRTNGYYEFTLLEEGDYQLTFTDVDGEENGSFKQKKEIISLTETLSLPVQLDNAD